MTAGDESLPSLIPIRFDSAKDRSNLEKHGVSLSRASELVVYATFPDERFDYPEPRRWAVGLIDEAPYIVVYAPLPDGASRVISVRRAHRKEYRRHVPTK